jgi:hypothetical protein
MLEKRILRSGRRLMARSGGPGQDEQRYVRNNATRHISGVFSWTRVFGQDGVDWRWELLLSTHETLGNSLFVLPPG